MAKSESCVTVERTVYIAVVVDNVIKLLSSVKSVASPISWANTHVALKYLILNYLSFEL